MNYHEPLAAVYTWPFTAVLQLDVLTCCTFGCPLDTVPAFTRVFDASSRKIPWLVLLAISTVLTVVPLLPVTLKKPRPLLREYTFAQVTLGPLLLATRKVA